MPLNLRGMSKGVHKAKPKEPELPTPLIKEIFSIKVIEDDGKNIAENQLLNLQEAAAYINESSAFIPFLLKTGKLKSYEYKKKIFFRKEDLDIYLNIRVPRPTFFYQIDIFESHFNIPKDVLYSLISKRVITEYFFSEILHLDFREVYKAIKQQKSKKEANNE